MADSDDFGGEMGGEMNSPRAQGRDQPPGAHHLRAASGALFVAVLPWAVAGYLLFSWAGSSIAAVLNEYQLLIGAAGIALGAFSLWQAVLACRHLLAWMIVRRGA